MKNKLNSLLQEAMGMNGDPQDIRSLPRESDNLKGVLDALRYISSPMLYDLNRLDMLIEIWEDDLPKVLRHQIKAIVSEMKNRIVQHGGKP